MHQALLLVLLLFLRIALGTNCDIAHFQRLADDVGFDGSTLNKYQDLVQQLRSCPEDNSLKQLKNKLLYKSGLIQLSLGQELSAIQSFQLVVDSNDDSFSSLAQARLTELYLKFGEWEKFPHEDELYQKVVSLNDTIFQKLRKRDFSETLDYAHELVEISPWSLEFRVIYNELLLHKLAGSIEVNTAQQIIENYQVILDKHKRRLPIDVRLAINYHIAILQFFVLNLQPTNLKKCLSLDMDYKPCRDMMKMVSKINKINPVSTCLTDPDEYVNAGEMDWNSIVQFYQRDEKPFLKTKKFTNNHNLLLQSAHDHINVLFKNRPLQKLGLDINTKSHNTEFTISIDVLLCTAYDNLHLNKAASRYCESAIAQVLSPEEQKSVKTYLSSLDGGRISNVSQILDKLWSRFPHLMSHVLHSIVQKLASHDRQNSSTDTTPHWTQLESIIKDKKFLHSSNKYVRNIAAVVSKAAQGKRQQRAQQQQQQQQRHFYQQQQRAAPPPQKTDKDYYKILEVPKNANTKDIRKAYLQLTKKYHPDKQQQLSENEQVANEEKMSAINEAYEILSDESKRKEYDLGRRSTGQGFGSAGGGGFPFGQNMNGGFKMHFGGFTNQKGKRSS